MAMPMQDFDVMVANILAVYDAANAEQRENGMRWYDDANTIANDFAIANGYSMQQCAAVIAILSPRKGWGENVNLAARVIAGRGTVTRGYFFSRLAMANAVLTEGTADMNYLSAVGKGDKVRAFFISITTAGNTDAVCVDRHAYCIAVNDRSMTNDVRLSSKEYRAIAAAYREAAHRRNITGAQMQAVTWVTWRNMHWSAGAFDGK